MHTKRVSALIILPVTLTILYLLLLPSNLTPQQFSNKAVLLCGPCTGVGEQMALHFAKQGARLILVARSDKRYETLFRLRDKFEVEDAAISQVEKLMVARTESKLEYIKEAAEEAGSPQVEIINAFDFSNVSQIAGLVEGAVSLFGGIDYLILNHAEMPRGHILRGKHQQTPDFISHLFSVNVYSHIELVSAALPHLNKSGGHIFVTSSLLGEVAHAKFPLYSSTKHALSGFFYSLQQDLIRSASPVSLTVGRFGEIKTEESQKMFGANDWITGSATECACRMLESLVARATTFTYPRLQPRIYKFLNSILPSY